MLIRGETGTGKELVARALHELSPRRDRTFVKLNCAAIPTGLLESELFGHEKGAFTGAISQKLGRFELAHQGTLFLDEVGDIPPELQPKLLRVLQEQEFERLGGTKTIKVDVRLVAATHRDLAQLVADGRFREDLYYRLNVFPLVLPPLRERRDDIPRLVRHFTQQFARRMGRRIETIPSAVMDALVRYSWPGNVRELQNVIERAVILSPGPSLQVPPGDLQPAPTQAPAPAAAPVTLADAEREHILGVLRETGWVLGGPKGAAARLGMKRSTLHWKMKKLGISRPASVRHWQRAGRGGTSTFGTPLPFSASSRLVRSINPCCDRLTLASKRTSRAPARPSALESIAVRAGAAVEIDHRRSPGPVRGSQRCCESRSTISHRPHVPARRERWPGRGVRVLEECWQTTVNRHAKPVLRIDLTGVTFIDAAGRACLAAMHRQGAEFIAPDCLMKAAVAEITQAPGPDRRRPR